MRIAIWIFVSSQLPLKNIPEDSVQAAIVGVLLAVSLLLCLWEDLKHTVGD